MKNSILSFILEKESLQRTQNIAEHFGLSAYQARYYFMELEKEGKVKRSPLRRGSSILWIATPRTEKTK
ncbi:FaeA/PapI family transcriptional regulator [Escherichia coli]